mmetsp:Transcript_59150/g.157411  ORF Transcript_59150/g.157411 Transcript_59150/m.157411 type:complete len:220 (-) Transcript_59150:132-791(-)
MDAEDGVVCVQLMDQSVRVCTDEALGVAGRPWEAQGVAADVLRSMDGENTIIELGAGCGALSCALALSGCRVVATDLPEVVPLMQRSVELNRVETYVDCRALSWGNTADLASVLSTLQDQDSSRLVVACEVAYWGGWDLFCPDTREPLAETLSVLIGASGVGLLVHTVRDVARESSLLEMIRAKCLDVHRERPLAAEPLLGEVGVWLLRRTPIISEPLG